MVSLARGTVLEIGVGPGVNFAHYDPAAVSKLYALEPNPGMLRLAERKRRRHRLDIEFIDLPGERIPLPDGSVDTVVSTFTLCTIPGIVDAIRGIRRVLRPDGQLIFFEIGIAPDPAVQRWQKRWEPFHHLAFGGGLDPGRSRPPDSWRVPDRMVQQRLHGGIPKVVVALLLGRCEIPGTRGSGQDPVTRQANQAVADSWRGLTR